MSKNYIAALNPSEINSVSGGCTGCITAVGALNPAVAITFLLVFGAVSVCLLYKNYTVIVKKDNDNSSFAFVPPSMAVGKCTEEVKTSRR